MNSETIKGNAWKFGDNISTDSIAPGSLIGLRSNPPEFAKHVLETARPEFCKNVKKNDFIVAGTNFGCGSSREIAPIIIKIAGVSAVLAKSFGRIFYRNAVNNGMLLIECNTDLIDEADELILDIENRQITKANDANFEINFVLSEQEIKIISEGGLLDYIDKYQSLDF